MTVKEWFINHGKTYGELGEELGISRQQAHQLVHRGCHSAVIAVRMSQAMNGIVSAEDIVEYWARGDVQRLNERIEAVRVKLGLTHGDFWKIMGYRRVVRRGQYPGYKSSKLLIKLLYAAPELSVHDVAALRGV